MTGAKATLAEGVVHLERVIEQFEAVRWQLFGILLSLPEPLAEQDRAADITEENDPVTELRSTIACVLDDSIRPALQDLRGVLADLKGRQEAR